MQFYFILAHKYSVYSTFTRSNTSCVLLGIFLQSILCQSRQYTILCPRYRSVLWLLKYQLSMLSAFLCNFLLHLC